MKPSHCRTCTQGDAVNFNCGATFFVTVVNKAATPVVPDGAIRSPMTNIGSAFQNTRDTRRLYRRVFVPSAQLLREGLPEPQV